MFYFKLLSSVQLLNYVRLCNPMTAACQASLSITNSRSLLKLTSLKSVLLSNDLILYHLLLLLPSIFPSIRVFSNVSPSHQVAKILEFQLQPQFFQWIFRNYFLFFFFFLGFKTFLIEVYLMHKLYKCVVYNTVIHNFKVIFHLLLL